MLNPMSPLGFLLAVLDTRLRRPRAERGASAVEWVIIAAIVVGICAAVALVLSRALQGEAEEIGNEIRNQ